MSKNTIAFITVGALLAISCLIFLVKNYTMKTENTQKLQQTMENNSKQIQLPIPNKKGDVSVQEAIQNRRSVRNFKSEPLSLQEVSQILWAGQGVTNQTTGYRAAPSAGALYPLEIYIAVTSSGVHNLETGVYHYLPKTHTLEIISKQYTANDLATAALNQSFIADAPASLIITAELERVTDKYSERGIQYVHMEAGHVAENIYLQVEALNLGTVAVGAFEDANVTNLLQTPQSHKPLYIMPIGHPK